jgi:hypothetical protein
LHLSRAADKRDVIILFLARIGFEELGIGNEQPEVSLKTFSKSVS